jgi:hypothetical protein
MLHVPTGVSGLSPVLRNPPGSPFDKGGTGIKGVDDRHEDGAGGFRLALPTLHVDSRLRGNDKTGAAARCRGLGCHQHGLDESSPYATSPCACSPSGRAEGGSPSAFLLSPKSGGQGVEKWHPGQPRHCPPASATSRWEAQTFYSVPTSGHGIPDMRGKRPC